MNDQRSVINSLGAVAGRSRSEHARRSKQTVVSMMASRASNPNTMSIRMVLVIVGLLWAFVNFSQPAFGAWAIDTAWAAGGTGGTGTTIPCSISAINAGTLAVAVFRSAASVTHDSVADDEGQTWAQAGTTLSNGDGVVSVWYKENHPGGTTVVVTLTMGSAAGRSSACGTYSGIATSSALDVVEGRIQANPGNGMDAITTNDGTPPTVTADGSLVLGVFWANTQAGTHAAGTDFTERLNTNAVTGEWLIEDRTLGASASAVATATTDSATADYHVYVVVFEIPVVAGGGVPSGLMLLGVGQ